MKITEAVVLITGAASGIGEAAAENLAALGASVFLGDMNEDKLTETVKRIKALGGKVAGARLDVTSENSVIQFMDAAIGVFGQINVLVPCAGIIRDAFLVTPDRETGKVKKFMTTDQWQQVLDVNLTGVFRCMREALIRMVDNGWKGALIPISSVNREGALGQLNYASTKAAIALWPKIIAGELHARNIAGIRIVSIAPGYVETPMLTSIREDILAGIISGIPIGRLIHPAEIADTIRFIIENEGLHATTIQVAGGIIGEGMPK